MGAAIEFRDDLTAGRQTAREITVMGAPLLLVEPSKGVTPGLWDVFAPGAFDKRKRTGERDHYVGTWTSAELENAPGRVVMRSTGGRRWHRHVSEDTGSWREPRKRRRGRSLPEPGCKW